MFNRWPTFGTPPVFESWSEMQAHIDRLTEVGAIDAPGRLYWTVRPSARFETLEVRMCDAGTTVDETVLLAALIRALVMASVGDAEAGRPVPECAHEVLRVAEWRAARFGLDGTLVDLIRSRSAAPGRVVEDLMTFVGPVLDATGDRAEVEDLLRLHMAHGTSAHRQRATFARTGSLGAVVEALVDETEPGDVGRD